MASQQLKKIGSCHCCFWGPIYQLDNDPKENSGAGSSTQRQGMQQFMLRDDLSPSIASHGVAGVVAYSIFTCLPSTRELQFSMRAILLSEVCEPLEQRNKSYPFCLISSFSSKTSPYNKITILCQMLYMQAAWTVHVQ